MVEEIKELAGNIKGVVDKQDKQEKAFNDLAQVVEGLAKKQGRYSAAAPGAGISAIENINEALEAHKDEIKSLKRGTKLEFSTKAGNITIGNFSSVGTAVSNPYSYDPNIAQRPKRKVEIRDLVPVIQSATGTFVWFSQPVGSVGSGSFAFQAGQGNLKAQLDYNLVQNITPLDYLAGYSRFSRQLLDDFNGIQSFLASQLTEDYRRSESNAFVPSLYAGSTAYTPASAVTAEKIVQAIGDLLSKDWSPSAIVTDAATWAKIINLKPNDYSQPGGIYTDPATGTVYFLGIPVLVQNNMAAGTIIVGDFSQAAIVQSTQGLNVSFFEADSDNIQRNLISCRCENRVAFIVRRADAFNRFVSGAS